MVLIHQLVFDFGHVIVEFPRRENLQEKRQESSFFHKVLVLLLQQMHNIYLIFYLFIYIFIYFFFFFWQWMEPLLPFCKSHDRTAITWHLPQFGKKQSDNNDSLSSMDKIWTTNFPHFTGGWRLENFNFQTYVYFRNILEVSDESFLVHPSTGSCNHSESRIWISQSDTRGKTMHQWDFRKKTNQ